MTTIKFANEYMNSSNTALYHEVTSIEQLKECLKAAEVFGLVVGKIEATGAFTTNTPKQSKEDKETQDWYNKSEWNTSGKMEQYDDENQSVYSYWNLDRIEGKQLVFKVDSQEIKVRFPMFPKTDRESYDNGQATLCVYFTKPEQL